MKPWKAVLLILIVLVVAAAGYGVSLVRRGFSALATPSAVEEFAATTARKLAVPSGYRQLRNPITPSPEIIHRGMEHFADHCATCHANDGGGKTPFGKGLYPKPPDLAAVGTQSKSDGELYYTIQNGVRLSGMPAFSEVHTDTNETWRLVLFIRHLPQITAEELKEMKGLNRKPQSNPADW
jgi:mono/diheme cytochrome c family protein